MPHPFRLVRHRDHREVLGIRLPIARSWLTASRTLVLSLLGGRLSHLRGLDRLRRAGFGGDDLRRAGFGRDDLRRNGLRGDGHRHLWRSRRGQDGHRLLSRRDHKRGAPLDGVPQRLAEVELLTRLKPSPQLLLHVRAQLLSIDVLGRVPFHVRASGVGAYRRCPWTGQGRDRDHANDRPAACRRNRTPQTDRKELRGEHDRSPPDRSPREIDQPHYATVAVDLCKIDCESSG